MVSFVYRFWAKMCISIGKILFSPLSIEVSVHPSSHAFFSPSRTGSEESVVCQYGCQSSGYLILPLFSPARLLAALASRAFIIFIYGNPPGRNISYRHVECLQYIPISSRVPDAVFLVPPIPPVSLPQNLPSPVQFPHQSPLQRQRQASSYFPFPPHSLSFYFSFFPPSRVRS